MSSLINDPSNLIGAMYLKTRPAPQRNAPKDIGLQPARQATERDKIAAKTAANVNKTAANVNSSSGGSSGTIS